MSHRFDADTAVWPAAAGGFETRIDPGWWVVSGPNGGYVAASLLRALALAAFSTERSGPGFADACMPEVPPPEACPAWEKRIEIHDRYEQRWAIGSPPFSGGEHALGGGWIRFPEPRPLDALAVAAFTDSFPPAVFSRMRDLTLTGGVPTIDLTIHFRAPLPLADTRPDAWVLAVFRSRLARGGFVEEDGEIWTRDGRLIAQSRQLALLR